MILEAIYYDVVRTSSAHRTRVVRASSASTYEADAVITLVRLPAMGCPDLVAETLRVSIIIISVVSAWHPDTSHCYPLQKYCKIKYHLPEFFSQVLNIPAMQPGGGSCVVLLYLQNQEVAVEPVGRPLPQQFVLRSCVV